MRSTERMAAVLLVVAGALAVGCAGGGGAPAAKQSVDPATAGRIAGAVRFSGKAPPPRKIKMVGADCAAHPEVEVADIDAHDGKLAGVFVYVKSGLEGYAFRAPAEPVVLDQVGCMFVPRVLGLMVGQPLRMKNSDPALHNVHTLPQVNEVYNRGFPTQGSVQETSFAEPEVMIPVRCDVHGWMQAWVGVLPHPFFRVTGADGAFAFEGLPPGSYVLEAWHVNLGAVQRSISLTPKQSVQVELAY